MSDSLQDQLIKAGLRSEQDAKKLRSDERKQGKAKRKKGKGGAQRSEASDAAARAQAEKRERDRALNRQRDAERKKQADEHAARELVVNNEIPHDGDIPFNFTYGSRIKQIYVDAEQQRRLAAGELAICRTRGRFRLVPREIAERVQPTAPFLVAMLDDGSASDDPAYEEHPVPDDLMW